MQFAGQLVSAWHVGLAGCRYVHCLKCDGHGPDQTAAPLHRAAMLKRSCLTSAVQSIVLFGEKLRCDSALISRY